jgi:hypothetical protein
MFCFNIVKHNHYECIGLIHIDMYGFDICNLIGLSQLDC